MDAFLQENPHASRTDEAHYLRGLARFNMKQYEPAKADLLDAVSGTKDTELRGKAALALGDLSLQTGDTTLAETMCRDAVGSLEELARNGEAKKEAPLLAEAYYRLGCVLQHLGQWRAADQQFSHVTYYYPDTEAASHAARAINASAWTVQAGSLARLSAAQADTKRFASLGQQVQADSRACRRQDPLRHPGRPLRPLRRRRRASSAGAADPIRRLRHDRSVRAASTKSQAPKPK